MEKNIKECNCIEFEYLCSDETGAIISHKCGKIEFIDIADLEVFKKQFPDIKSYKYETEIQTERSIVIKINELNEPVIILNGLTIQQSVIFLKQSIYQLNNCGIQIQQ